MVTKRPYGPVLKELEELLDTAWSEELMGRIEKADKVLGKVRTRIRTLSEIVDDWKDDLFSLSLRLGREGIEEEEEG